MTLAAARLIWVAPLEFIGLPFPSSSPIRATRRSRLRSAQYVFSSQFATNYPQAFASYLMAMAPVLVVYIFAQKWVVGGVMRGAVK